MARLVVPARTSRWMCAWVRRLAVDTSGQDLLEYALLSAFVGLVALATMNQLGITMADVYSTLVGNVNDLWETPPH